MPKNKKKNNTIDDNTLKTIRRGHIIENSKLIAYDPGDGWKEYQDSVRVNGEANSANWPPGETYYIASYDLCHNKFLGGPYDRSKTWYWDNSGKIRLDRNAPRELLPQHHEEYAALVAKYLDSVCSNAVNVAKKSVSLSNYIVESIRNPISKAIEKRDSEILLPIHNKVQNALRVAREAFKIANIPCYKAIEASNVATKASESAETFAKEAEEVVAVLLLDCEFGKNTLVYSKCHDMGTSRLLARMDSLITAVRNSSLSDPFSHVPTPVFE